MMRGVAARFVVAGTCRDDEEVCPSVTSQHCDLEFSPASLDPEPEAHQRRNLPEAQTNGEVGCAGEVRMNMSLGVQPFI